tara:strand:- start:206 stop:673 length:468 start_codon:yes stop_codon:yes gene_type:complete
MGLQETFHNWAERYSIENLNEDITGNTPQQFVQQQQTKPKYSISQGSVQQPTVPPEWPSGMPDPLPPGWAIGHGILNWFMWFVDQLQNMQGDFANPQMLDWSAMGYPPYVQSAWNAVSDVIGGEWNQNGLNSILAQWGEGGSYGGPWPDGGPNPV